MTGASLTDVERAALLEPCACGHDFEDHGGLGNCWTCLDDNRECDRNFEDLLCERVAVIVESRIASFGDGGRHAGTRVQHRVRVAQDDECGDMTGFGMTNGLGVQREADSGSAPQNGDRP